VSSCQKVRLDLVDTFTCLLNKVHDAFFHDLWGAKQVNLLKTFGASDVF
jgi:hypothetical protein